MDVLVCLAAEPGRVVGKEALLEAVWGGGFVEEGVLSQAVHSLRKALDDDARQPRYIQTVPKRGYRLIAAVVLEVASGAILPVISEASPGLDDSPPAQAPVPPVRRRIWRWFPLVAVSLTAVMAGWLGRDKLAIVLGRQPVEAPDHGSLRIVVLPFENLGKPEDNYFADGLTEEITKDLASLASIQVISRTSAVAFKGKGEPLRDIGRELNVDYVLEGTVRWATGPGGVPRVRITPQLIRVKDDTHVWAESYDQGVENIFEVQAEISRRVISQLDLSLMPGERWRPRQSPTQNLEAYHAYLRGLELRNQPFYSESHIRSSVPMFERAVALDPGFAAAWAELSQTQSYLAFNSDQSPAQVERARRPLERARALNSDLPEVLLAQAYFTYRCLGDYEAAEKQLTDAARKIPNNANLLQTLGFVLRRRGRLGEAIERLEQATSLDPKTVRLTWAIAETHRALRNYKQADLYYAQAISASPDQVTFWEERALNKLDWTGDLQAALNILADSPVRDDPRLSSAFFLLDFYGRDYQRALARLTPRNLEQLAPQLESQILTLGVIARERLGDRRGALAAAEANQATLAARVERYPLDPAYQAYLAVTLAQLGRKEEAQAQVEKALQLVREDAFAGPRYVEVQALMEIILGQRKEAVGRLCRLVNTSYQGAISATDLRLNPTWDSLRKEPAFEELLSREP
jgi:TolB-like protein/Flp pilus assembly protein TadD